MTTLKDTYNASDWIGVEKIKKALIPASILNVIGLIIGIIALKKGDCLAIIPVFIGALTICFWGFT